MKKKFTIVLATLTLVLAFGSGIASAAYKPASNINLNLTLLPGLLKTSSTTGDLTFQLQESVLQGLSNSTGIEIDHSYVMVGLNGSNVLAVDPPAALFNKKK